MEQPRRRCAVALAALLAVTARPAGASNTIVVNPGQSIQAAIDAAAPGTTILVRAGTYAENLEIKTDDLTLRGAGAGRTILIPPGAPVQRFCTPDPNDPFVAGICATGSIDFNTAEVSRFLHGTRISGFSVRGFSGVGLILVAVDQGVVEANEVSGNAARGIQALNSTRTRIAFNLARDNDGSGIQIDKVEFVSPGTLPPSRATIVFNRASGNRGPGVFAFDADSGQIAGNVSTGNCAGMLLVNLAGTGRDWTVSFNSVSRNSLVCPPGGGPPLSGLGIGVIGAAQVRIDHNLVIGAPPGGPSLPAGGIAIESAAPFGGADASDVRVTDNVLRDNVPVDLSWDGAGSGIAFVKNRCASSVPAGLCQAQ